MARTEFTMYAGIDTIGGVIAEVRRGRHRVIFEMGSAYNPNADFYGGGIKQRHHSWLRDGIRLGMIPKIDGLYPAAALDGVDDVLPAEDSDVETIVFITHLHLDHMAYMGAVHPDIPVYLHENAQRIEFALAATGDGVPTFRTEYTPYTPGEPTQWGEIELLPLLSYTAAYGHSSCLISTPDGSVHWTGDLVMHRPEEETNRLAEIELLQQRGVDVLICDCCEFMHESMIEAYSGPDGVLQPSLELPAGCAEADEEALQRDELFTRAGGLIVVNHYQREMEDVQILQDLCDRFGRTLVLEPDSAWIVHRYFGTPPAVYLPDSTRFNDGAPRPWLDQLLASAPHVTATDIRANPAGYVLQVSFPNMLELLDMPSAGGIFVQMGGDPIGDFHPEWPRMVDMVQRCGFELASMSRYPGPGHSTPGAVRYYVEKVAPKVLIPAHSFNPERLEAPSGTVRMFPELGVRYELAEGRLTRITD